ncbi:HNH endonuclease [Streptomyces sp. NPDC002540]
MAVSKRLRYEILRRDNHTCRYCGATAPDAPLRVDHVTPVALGGTDTPDNLVASCEPCNSGKSSATVDAAVVAGVSDDALRWADAMKQAATELSEQNQPKLDYRNAFEAEWNSWTYPSGGKRLKHELPADWKTSLERFRQAGLPQEAWPDIIEKAMTNKTVKADNIFRYCCGIAWRMISDLQDSARRIVGAQPAKSTAQTSPFGQIVVDLWAANWLADHDETVSEPARAEFMRSLRDHQRSSRWLAPDELLKAALFGAGERCTTIQECVTKLAEHELAEIVIEWGDAWADLTGDVPDPFLYTVVHEQVKDLAEADPSLTRTRRAALLAAYHQSSELHHGLRRSEVELTGVDVFQQKALETWSRAFQASSDRWPTAGERACFINHLNRFRVDSDSFLFRDVFAAAAAAGAYQDPDLSTCLPRGDSVFEAAARPLAPTS